MRARYNRLREGLRSSGLDSLLGHSLVILGVALVAAVLCGLVLHPRGLAIAGGLAVVILLGVVWPWISLRGLWGQLDFGQVRGREGQPVAVSLRLASSVPWGAWGLVLRLGEAEDAASLALSHVPGWRRSDVTWSFVPPRRGIYPNGGASISTGFPFGLREARRPIVVERPLLVWPRTYLVGPIPEGVGGEAADGAAFRNRPGDAGDLMGVRPYRRGDPLRRVHWAQTARQDGLIICEMQTAAAPRVQIVLDLDPQNHVGEGPDGSLEWSIRVAASFLEDWIGQGAEVELVAGGQVLTSRGRSVAARRSELLDGVARLDPRSVPRLELVLGGPACRRFGKGLRIVVCSDLARIAVVRPTGATTERYVVLASAAFGEGRTIAATVDPHFAVRPWVLLNNPSRMAQQLLQRKEGLHVS